MTHALQRMAWFCGQDRCYDFSDYEKNGWLSQSCWYRESCRIPDSIILVPVEVGLILRLDKCTWQLSLDQDGINSHFLFSQLFGRD